MEELKKEILTLCNSSNLPIEAIMFVLKDAWRDAEAALREVKEQARMHPSTQDSAIIEEEEK